MIANRAQWSISQIEAVSPLSYQLSEICTDAGNQIQTCGELYQAEQYVLVLFFLMVSDALTIMMCTRFVMESLKFFPDIYVEGPPASPIDLKDLENVLSRMTAVEVWAGQFFRWSYLILLLRNQRR
jgi:hypothetical protein